MTVTSGQGHPDARVTAAALTQVLAAEASATAFCCYGTAQSVLLGVGRAASLELGTTSTLNVVWKEIERFLEQHAGHYVMGYIGFDPANQLQSTLADYRQKIDLWVPGCVIECSAGAWKVLAGEPVIASASLERAIDKLLEPGTTSTLDLAEIDQSTQLRTYQAAVAEVLARIASGKLERATLARKLSLDIELSLPHIFLADQGQHPLARSFYVSTDQLGFAGQCPELLAEGDLDGFVTHKLSGTREKSAGADAAELASLFFQDQRIFSEHASGVATIERSLAEIGEVRANKFQLMELPSLLHGWSEFHTRPKPDTSVANCLRSVLPFGVNPVEPGFELLQRHEHFVRGPYYGLVGLVTPAASFSFTQALRSAFVDVSGSYLLAGAAITADSTPALEAEETCSKLRSIPLLVGT